MATPTERPQTESRRLDALARRRLPGGVNSNVRLSAPRTFFTHAKGAWMWDVDGNDYVDFLLGQGPNILGHGHSAVHEAVSAATEAGMVYGAQHPLEILAADKFVAATQWPEMVRFGVSGTESVQAALRVARAATGHDLVVRFSGHYHGWLDDLLTGYAPDGSAGPGSAGQLKSRLADSVVISWNDADALAATLDDYSGHVAAVIMEPIMLNQGSILPAPGYLESVRDLCDQHGVILIFDEVITGFRAGLSGAAGRFSVTPDLAVYGKAIAAGWPVSALAGRADLLEPVGTGTVNISGTFNGSVMGMAAVAAVMDVLRTSDPYIGMETTGERLMAELNRMATSRRLPLHVQGLPQAFHASWGERGGKPLRDYRDVFTQDAKRYAAVADALASHGVWVAGRGIWYVSVAHDEAALDTALERIDRAFSTLNNA